MFYSSGKAVRPQPPSQIVQDYKKKNENVSDPDIQNLARKCLVGPEEVKLRLEHLHQVEENRRKGAEKARVSRKTRQKKKSMDTISESSKAVLLQRTSTGSVLYSLLYALTLPKLFA